MIRTSLGEGGASLSIESCRFVTTAVGTAVYGHDGSYIGLYETEDAAVEMIRLLISEHSEGGSSDEI